VGCKEDYYKFTHQLMPHTVFNHGRLLVYRLMRNEELFIENLKITWSTIELEKPQLRSSPPDFALHIIDFNIEHTGIILSVPAATEDGEAVYIGIIYDKNDNFRYFTYEIGKGIKGETLYFLCECTADWEHFNYGCHFQRDKSIFIKEISELLVYDLL
jgi:hypothetical protein